MRPTRIKLRRNTSSYWETVNPVLEEGEPGFARDTRELKIGDGETKWRDLDPYPFRSNSYLGSKSLEGG